MIDHNNFIGGRYSVLSEVGMLPASLMGLNEKKFKQFNNLIKKKKFFRKSYNNTSNIIYFSKQRRFNSIIINYDGPQMTYLNGINNLLLKVLEKIKRYFSNYFYHAKR